MIQAIQPRSIHICCRVAHVSTAIRLQVPDGEALRWAGRGSVGLEACIHGSLRWAASALRHRIARFSGKEIGRCGGGHIARDGRKARRAFKSSFVARPFLQHEGGIPFLVSRGINKLQQRVCWSSNRTQKRNIARFRPRPFGSQEPAPRISVENGRFAVHMTRTAAIPRRQALSARHPHSTRSDLPWQV